MLEVTDGNEQKDLPIWWSMAINPQSKTICLAGTQVQTHLTWAGFIDKCYSIFKLTIKHLYLEQQKS